MVSSSFNFTKEAIDKIICPEAMQHTHEGAKSKTVRPKTVQHIYRDTKESGLVLVASYGNSKTFYLFKTIDSKYRKIKLGTFPNLSISEARTKAADFKAQIRKGINPVEKLSLSLPDNEVDHELTFKELFDKYIDDYAKHKIQRWQHVIADINRQAAHLYDRKISTIKRDDIQKIFNDITQVGKKVMANKCVERFTGIFNRAIEWELLEKNPALGIEKHREKSRTRFLTKEEIPRFLAAINKEPNQKIADFFLISLLTGARKGNVLSMQWQNIYYEDRAWYIPDTKNGEPQLVHLVDDAIKILKKRSDDNNTKSIWVFPSSTSKSGHLQEPKKVWKRICQTAGLDGLRIHDLRRTHGSWMRRAGADREIIGEALNHKSLKSTEVYDIIESDQVKEYREKAMTNLMSLKENKKVQPIRLNKAEGNIEKLKNKIKELEQQVKELENMQVI